MIPPMPPIYLVHSRMYARIRITDCEGTGDGVVTGTNGDGQTQEPHREAGYDIPSFITLLERDGWVVVGWFDWMLEGWSIWFYLGVCRGLLGWHKW